MNDWIWNIFAKLKSYSWNLVIHIRQLLKRKKTNFEVTGIENTSSQYKLHSVINMLTRFLEPLSSFINLVFTSQRNIIWSQVFTQICVFKSSSLRNVC